MSGAHDLDSSNAETEKPLAKAARFMPFAFDAIKAKNRNPIVLGDLDVEHYSLAGQSWLMGILCLAIPSGINKIRCLSMAISSGVAKVSEPYSLPPLAQELWVEFNERESAESKIVHEIEKIAQLLLALHFSDAKQHLENLSTLMKIVEDVVLLKHWVDEIRDVLSQSWYNTEAQSATNTRESKTWSIDTALEALPLLDRILSHKNSFTSFAFISCQLLSRKRRGWIRHGIEEPESVAEHSWNMAALCFLSLEGLQLDVNLCVAMAVVHDMAESLVGDITPADKINKQEKYRREGLTIKFIVDQLPESPLPALWGEFEDKETPESRAVQDMDKIEMMTQGLCYEKANHHEKDLSEFMGAIRLITVLKDIGHSIITTREMYWQGRANKVVDAEVEREQKDYYGA